MYVGELVEGSRLELHDGIVNVDDVHARAAFRFNSLDHPRLCAVWTTLFTLHMLNDKAVPILEFRESKVLVPVREGVRVDPCDAGQQQEVQLRAEYWFF